MAQVIFDPNKFRDGQISSLEDKSSIAAAVADFSLMLGSVMETLVQRFERNENYPFIDTKLSMYDGREFDDDPIRGRGVIYSWIQGRGLEALAGHLSWLQRSPVAESRKVHDFCSRLRYMLETVFDAMEQLRARNDGRLFFMMTPEGDPLRLGSDGKPVPHRIEPDAPANSSDIFYVKGMAAAAAALNRPEKLAEAERWFRSICKAVATNRVVSDQQPLDPKNVGTQKVEGRLGHGARMLCTGGAALFLELTGDPWYLEQALSFIDRTLDLHVNLTEEPAMGLPYDMWEFVDRSGKPWLDPQGRLYSDPGHSTEFVGLALKLLRAAKQKGLAGRVSAERMRRYRTIMPRIVERNFWNGFSERGFGICKTCDLRSRTAVNSDMPWWSLPETIRAGLEAAQFCESEGWCKAMAEVARKCANAFVRHYVRRDLHLMAYQTLNAEGTAVDVIPATPDADPGYHTGLSIIDALEVLKELLPDVE